MDKQQQSRAWEANHAMWWTIDGEIRGEKPKARKGFSWTCDTGGASLHELRLSERTATKRLDDLIDEAAVAGGAIWAHATEHATPDNLIETMRKLGFQHCKRFASIACDLSKLPALPKAARSVRTEQLTDYSVFDTTTEYPGIGPITTKTRKAALAQLQARAIHRPNDVIRMMTYVNGVPACTATTFIHGGIAGLYDVATLEEFRGKGLARRTALAALLAARQIGVTHAATISTVEAEALYEDLGFTPVGWTSMLYYSKTKLERRRKELSVNKAA